MYTCIFLYAYLFGSETSIVPFNQSLHSHQFYFSHSCTSNLDFLRLGTVDFFIKILRPRETVLCTLSKYLMAGWWKSTVMHKVNLKIFNKENKENYCIIQSLPCYFWLCDMNMSWSACISTWWGNDHHSIPFLKKYFFKWEMSLFWYLTPLTYVLQPGKGFNTFNICFEN